MSDRAESLQISSAVLCVLALLLVDYTRDQDCKLQLSRYTCCCTALPSPCSVLLQVDLSECDLSPFSIRPLADALSNIGTCSNIRKVDLSNNPSVSVVCVCVVCVCVGAVGM